MSRQEREGRHKRIEGEGLDNIGKAFGDKSEQIEGKGQQVEGRIEEAVGEAKRKLRE
jgi:uncharacterized protein YjbJ (UPF0337 family)